MRARRISLAGLIGLLLVLAGFVIGARPPGDNSFLTHLATGRIIWDTRRVPSVDPYTFTAGGKAWVVQSWLASLLYAAADHLGGLRAIMVLVGSSAAAMAGLVWLLTRSAVTLVPRLAVAGLTVAIGAAYWVERPLLFGLLGMGLVLLSAEGRLAPRWLVLVMWCWANVHGSFPFGLVVLAAMVLGRRLDREPMTTELEALRWAALGVVLAVVSPLGLRVLTFPVELLARQGVLRYVAEWQAPRFTSVAERLFLVQVLLFVMAVARRRRWRDVLPGLVLLGAALVASRNIVVASVVLVPALAFGLADLGTITGAERRSVFRPAAMVMVALSAIMALSSLADPLRTIEQRYPVQAVEVAASQGLVSPRRHLVTQDTVGNYLELRFGPAAQTFVDDRYDMLPTRLVDDFVTLDGGTPGWQSVLERYGADAVLWERQKPLPELLLATGAWRAVYADSKWLLLVRRSGP